MSWSNSLTVKLDGDTNHICLSKLLHYNLFLSRPNRKILSLYTLSLYLHNCPSVPWVFIWIMWYDRSPMLSMTACHLECLHFCASISVCTVVSFIFDPCHFGFKSISWISKRLQKIIIGKRSNLWLRMIRRVVEWNKDKKAGSGFFEKIMLRHPLLFMISYFAAQVRTPSARCRLKW